MESDKPQVSSDKVIEFLGIGNSIPNEEAPGTNFQVEKVEYMSWHILGICLIP